MSEGFPPAHEPTPDMHETVGEVVGIRALEEQYADNPAALGLNTAMALASALRWGGSVLRTNQDVPLLHTTTSEVIVQGYQRLLHPEATNFPEVYGALFEKLVPSSSSPGSLALFLADNLQERTDYQAGFGNMSNQQRHDIRSGLLGADAQICIGLEKIIEDYLTDHIAAHQKAAEGMFHPEVFETFCEKTLRSSPVVRTVRGLATSSLITHKRATGLSAAARAWLRSNGGGRIDHSA